MATELEKFAWPGGYTILYHFTQSNDSLLLCWEYATKAVKGIEEQNSDYEDYKNRDSFIHWEGESLWYDDCGVELESEYGNPNEEENQPQVDAGELACEKTPTPAMLPDEEEPTLVEIRHREKYMHELANPER